MTKLTVVEVIFDRDKYPGLIIGISKIYKTKEVVFCPRCWCVCNIIMDIYSRLLWKCEICGHIWPTEGIIDEVRKG